MFQQDRLEERLVGTCWVPPCRKPSLHDCLDRGIALDMPTYARHVRSCDAIIPSMRLHALQPYVCGRWRAVFVGYLTLDFGFPTCEQAGSRQPANNNVHPLPKNPAVCLKSLSVFTSMLVYAAEDATCSVFQPPFLERRFRRGSLLTTSGAPACSFSRLSPCGRLLLLSRVLEVRFSRGLVRGRGTSMTRFLIR